MLLTLLTLLWSVLIWHKATRLYMVTSSKWKHFPRYWPFARGIHRSPGNSPHKGQWRGTLKFLLIYAWINGWVNNRKAGDLRRHCAHYDVTVMTAGKTHILLSKWKLKQRFIIVLVTHRYTGYTAVMYWYTGLHFVNICIPQSFKIMEMYCLPKLPKNLFRYS